MDSIDEYLNDILDVVKQSANCQEPIITHVQDIIGNRLDVSCYKNRFELISQKYENKRLASLVIINPTVKFNDQGNDIPISFVPMECIDEKYGAIKERRQTAISQTKGFTKFNEGDLLWAKITPCMQNGKSAIARSLINGLGCGSTEFYVIRPKSDNLSIDFGHLLLCHRRVLSAAQTSFGGSAGQQRVSNQYLKSIIIPHPPIKVRKNIVSEITRRKIQAKQLESEGNILIENAKTQIEKNDFAIEYIHHRFCAIFVIK